MAQDSFTLKLIRPLDSREVSVVWVEAEAPNGSFLIGPGHGALFSLLKSGGRLSYKTTHNLEVEVDVYGGILSVTDSNVIVVFD